MCLFIVSHYHSICVITYHVDDFEVSGGEDDGVWRRAYRKHVGEGRGDGARYHEVQWVHRQPDGLQ